MALHTRGNQPSRQRVLMSIGNAYTLPMTNENVVEIGVVYITGMVDINIPDIEGHNVTVLIKD